MQTIILLKGFNNYYNRKLKYYDNYTDYLDYAYDNSVGGTYTNINFNPNDGVRTEHIFNLELNDKQEFPDYLLVLDENSNIISRWYILESTRLRNGQYRLNLKRDTLADNINSLFNVPINLEKVGGFYSENDIAITNKEPNINVNQIKTKQELLKDNSETPWIVGYMVNKSEFDTTTSKSIIVDRYIDNVEDFDMETTILSNYNLNIYSQEYKYSSKSNIEQDRLSTTRTLGGNTLSNLFNENSNLTEQLDLGYDLYVGYNTITRHIENLTGNGTNNTILEEIKNLDGYIYEDIHGNHYKLEILETIMRDANDIEVTNNGVYQELYNYMKTALNESTRDYGFEPNQYVFTFDYTITKYTAVLTPYDDSAISVTIPGTRNNLKDAPYDMFITPYNTTNIKINATDTITQTNENILTIVNGLTNKLSSDNARYIYDVQILPYCAIQNLITTGIIDISLLTENIDYSYVMQGENKVGVLIYPTLSSFEFTIQHKIPYSGTILDKKIENQCSFYRLCSPNYSSIFEFNPILNKGVDYFNISCTYKPYQPYIKVAPNFKYLYGQKYKDNRGLILGGDYSMPITTNAYESYQLSNKNFTNIFERGIQNMETQYKYQNIQQMISSPLNAIGTGLTAGALSGNPILGILGGSASLLGGIADMGINRALQQEQLDYTKQIHEYQLDNIKALPDTLSRVGAYNIDNNYFPFLEYYTCTDIEKEQVRNMLRYNGYTYNRIDTLKNFISYKNSNTFFKGTIVRNDKTFEDYHMLNDLNSELNQGIYLNIEEDING